ncbi:unnamed protein product [Boreogadus saida]
MRESARGRRGGCQHTAESCPRPSCPGLAAELRRVPGTGSSSSNNERQGEEESSSVLCFTTTCPPGPSSRPPGPSPDHLATVQTTTRTRSDPALGQAEVPPENGALLKAGSTRRECPALLWPGFLSRQKVIHFYSAKLTHRGTVPGTAAACWVSRAARRLGHAPVLSRSADATEGPSMPQLKTASMFKSSPEFCVTSQPSETSTLWPTQNHRAMMSLVHTWTSIVAEKEGMT